MRRDQYIFWRDQLDELLNQSAGLRGVAKVLEKVRMWKNTATEEDVRQVRTEGGCEIDAEHASVEKIKWKSEELFSLLRLKHNTRTNCLCKDVMRDVGRNGFEMYRRMSREYDPQTDGTALVLMTNVLTMGTSGARKTFDETYEAYRQLRNLIDEHDKVTPSGRLDESLKVWRTGASRTSRQRRELRPEQSSARRQEGP